MMESKLQLGLGELALAVSKRDVFFIYWLCKRATESPSLIEPKPQKPVRYTNCFSPPSHAFLLSHEFNHPICPRVSRLFFACRPSAIRRPSVRDTFLAVAATVVAVIINSVDLIEIAMAWTHVRKKVSEVSPAFAHHNAATSIIRPRDFVLIVAAPSNPLPHLILRSAAKAMQYATRLINFVVRRSGLVNAFRRFDVVFHIVFSRSRSVTWGGFCAFRLSQQGA